MIKDTEDACVRCDEAFISQDTKTLCDACTKLVAPDVVAKVEALEAEVKALKDSIVEWWKEEQYAESYPGRNKYDCDADNPKFVNMALNPQTPTEPNSEKEEIKVPTENEVNSRYNKGYFKMNPLEQFVSENYIEDAEEAIQWHEQFVLALKFYANHSTTPTLSKKEREHLIDDLGVNPIDLPTPTEPNGGEYDVL